MVVYFLILTIVSLLIWAAQSFVYAQRTPAATGPLRARNWIKNPLYILALSILVVFGAVRQNVGSDYGLYLGIHSRLDPEEWRYYLSESPQEVGFTIVSLLTKHFVSDDRAIFAVISTLVILPLAVAVPRLTHHVAVAWVLLFLFGFYLGSFNVMRQAIAMSIVALAVTYVGRARIKFVALAVLAASFHASALPVAAILFGMRKVAISWRIIWITAAVGVGGAAAFAQLSFLNALAASLNPRYEEYMVTDGAGVGTYMVVLSRVLLLGCGLILLRRMPQHGVGESQASQLLAAGAVGLAFLIVGTQSVVVGRIELYFGMLLTIGFAGLLAQSRSIGVKVLVGIGGALYFVAYLMYFGDLVPYRSFF